MAFQKKIQNSWVPKTVRWKWEFDKYDKAIKNRKSAAISFSELHKNIQWFIYKCYSILGCYWKTLWPKFHIGKIA